MSSNTDRFDELTSVDNCTNDSATQIDDSRDHSLGHEDVDDGTAVGLVETEHYENDSQSNDTYPNISNKNDRLNDSNIKKSGNELQRNPTIVEIEKHRYLLNDEISSKLNIKLEHSATNYRDEQSPQHIHEYTQNDSNHNEYNNNHSNQMTDYTHRNELKREIINEEISLSQDQNHNSIEPGVHYNTNGAGGLWWAQNQTPAVSTAAYDMTPHGVITSVVSKTARLNGANLINYNEWYGSHPTNVIISSTPTTTTNSSNVTTAHSDDSYINYQQNQNPFQSQHQIVVRSQQSNHRRSNSTSEGIPDLFSPTEGRECVNCGKL
jgi:hypothetical protein